MDFVNLMTYDMCPWDKVGYHTALYPSKDGISPNAAASADFYEAAGYRSSSPLTTPAPSAQKRPMSKTQALGVFFTGNIMGTRRTACFPRHWRSNGF